MILGFILNFNNSKHKSIFEKQDIHNNNSASFNESHLQFSELKFEPNDLLVSCSLFTKNIINS